MTVGIIHTRAGDGSTVCILALPTVVVTKAAYSSLSAVCRSGAYLASPDACTITQIEMPDNVTNILSGII